MKWHDFARWENPARTKKHQQRGQEQYSAMLTEGLQHLDGERLRIQLQILAVNKRPVKQCLIFALFRQQN